MNFRSRVLKFLLKNVSLSILHWSSSVLKKQSVSVCHVFQKLLHISMGKNQLHPYKRRDYKFLVEHVIEDN